MGLFSKISRGSSRLFSKIPEPEKLFTKITDGIDKASSVVSDIGSHVSDVGNKIEKGLQQADKINNIANPILQGAALATGGIPVLGSITSGLLAGSDALKDSTARVRDVNQRIQDGNKKVQKVNNKVKRVNNVASNI